MKTKLSYVFAIAVFALCFASCKKSTPPTVKIYNNISSSYTSANVTGEVTDEGSSPVIDRGFIYGKQGEARQDTMYCGNGAGEFPTRLTNLEPNTTYNCMAFARNDAGTSYSGKATFTTLPMAQSEVTTYEATSVTHTHATCGGIVISDGGSEVTERGVCWATTPNPTTSDSHLASGTGTGEFSVNLSGLTANTTYHVRAYAENEQGTAYGDDVAFSTVAYNIPTVVTCEITNITATSATCGGNVTSDGGASVTARGVCWSTSQNPTVNGSHTTDGTGTGSFTSQITGLTQGPTYYVRAYATNSAGTSYGEQKTINTISVPTVTTDNVTNIRAHSALCGGNVTSDGGAAVIERGICWSTSSNPTINSSHISSDSGTSSFTVQMTDLSATTTYYVRAYAKNSAGVAYGSLVSFTTSEVFEDWLGYGLLCDHWNCWGFNSSRNVEWAVMFPASMLEYSSDLCITRVDAYLGEVGWYDLHIYKGGTIHPTTLLYEKNIYVRNSGWNSFMIDPLLLPNNQSLWVSISCYNNGGEYPMGCNACGGDENARWFYNEDNGAWVDFMTLNDNVDMGWDIQVYISNDVKGNVGREMPLSYAPVSTKRNDNAHSNNNKVLLNPHERLKKYK